MHLVIIVAGVGIGGWALIGLRRKLPRGRLVVFGIASGGALFGCAALAGEVGIVPPAVWFGIVMAAMIGTIGIAIRSTAPRTSSA
jgi:hypothetical protein